MRDGEGVVGRRERATPACGTPKPDPLLNWRHLSLLAALMVQTRNASAARRDLLLENGALACGAPIIGQAASQEYS